MTEPFNLTTAYVQSLTGDPSAVLDWRCIHDTDRARPAHNFRGTLTDHYQTLQQYNANGYGIFVCINAMDGVGRDLTNVAYIRTHVVDLDNLLTSRASYDRAVATAPQPHFAVQTSPDKFHLYWLVEPYQGNDFYSIQQRKLRQLYDGDRSVIDASRVLRVPGFHHLKNPATPYMVTCWSVSGTGRYNPQVLADWLAPVNVFDSVHTRSPLGEPTLSAPSLDWLRFGLSLVDPNELPYDEWMSITAAFKQAGWNHASPEQLQEIWQAWCGSYGQNDSATNTKLWNSIKDTEIGWGAFERRTPVKAYIQFGFQDPATIVKPVVAPAVVPGSAPISPGSPRISPDAPEYIPAYMQPEKYPEILDAQDCAEWFSDCYFIERMGEMFSRSGRFMNSTKFNGKYGGKHFIITSTGKTTDEAWKAALRSTCGTVRKVDHVRFLPTEKPFAVIKDEMGREGINTYLPTTVDARPGDVSMFLNWIDKILPVKTDQQILLSYLAHCIKFPGHKLPWAPLLQSVEGIGKTAFRELLAHALGDMYVYQPKAPELISSGSKFNAWMRGKLMIVVDEIKIDERRELIEILKPMITDARIEVQSKGVDQDMEDNVSNWLLFSNWQDAMPITRKGRRFSVFYSAIQTVQDLLNAGLDDAFFGRFWKWLREEGGYAAITHWLLNYPVELGGLPVRAPETSSYAEALKNSRSPLEIVVHDCIEDGVTGFRGGYVSTLALVNRAKITGLRNVTVRSAQQCLQSMGFIEIGKPSRAYAQEDTNNRAIIFAAASNLKVEDYGPAQGYF